MQQCRQNTASRNINFPLSFFFPLLPHNAKLNISGSRISFTKNRLNDTCFAPFEDWNNILFLVYRSAGFFQLLLSTPFDPARPGSIEKIFDTYIRFAYVIGHRIFIVFLSPLFFILVKIPRVSKEIGKKLFHRLLPHHSRRIRKFPKRVPWVSTVNTEEYNSAHNIYHGFLLLLRRARIPWTEVSKYLCFATG